VVIGPPEDLQWL